MNSRIKRIVVWSKERIESRKLGIPFSAICLSRFEGSHERMHEQFADLASQEFFLRDDMRLHFIADEITRPQCELIRRFVAKCRTRTLLIQCDMENEKAPSIALAIADAIGISRENVHWSKGNVTDSAPRQDVYLTLLQWIRESKMPAG